MKLRDLINLNEAAQAPFYPEPKDTKVEFDKPKIKKFEENISNDLATPEVLAIIWKMLKSELSAEDKWATLLHFDKILGLKLDRKKKVQKIPLEILELVEERQQARENKKWKESDRLREVIKKKGYLVEDLENNCKIRPIT